MATEACPVAVVAAAVTRVAMAAPGLQLATLDGVGFVLDGVQAPLAPADEALKHKAGVVHFSLVVDCVLCSKPPLSTLSIVMISIFPVWVV